MPTMDVRNVGHLNIIPLMKETEKQLEKWKSLKISWFGRIAAVKMKIIPKFIFVFHTLVLSLPLVTWRRIQASLSKFIWAYKKPRMKISTMQQTKSHGGIALSNILIEAILQWWSEDSRDIWEWEQEVESVSLRESVLSVRDHPDIQTNNMTANILSKF